MRTAAIAILFLACEVAWAQPGKPAPPPQPSPPDTRSDHLRTESVQAPKPASSLRLNLNKASAAELMKLPGIDAATAKAIIKGRPYRSKEEVLRKRILPAARYEELKANLYAGM